MVAYRLACYQLTVPLRVKFISTFLHIEATTEVTLDGSWESFIISAV